MPSPFTHQCNTLLQKLDNQWHTNGGVPTQEFIDSLNRLIALLASSSSATTPSTTQPTTPQLAAGVDRGEAASRMEAIRSLCNWLLKNRVSMLHIGHVGHHSGRPAERLWHNVKDLLIARGRSTQSKLLAIQVISVILDHRETPLAAAAAAVPTYPPQSPQSAKRSSSSGGNDDNDSGDTTTTAASQKVGGRKEAVKEQSGSGIEAQEAEDHGAETSWNRFGTDQATYAEYDANDEEWIPLLVDMFQAVRGCRDSIDPSICVRVIRLISRDGLHIMTLGTRALISMLIELVLVRSRTVKERLDCCRFLLTIVQKQFSAILVAEQRHQHRRYHFHTDRSQEQLLAAIVECMTRIIWANMSEDLNDTALSVIGSIVSNIVVMEEKSVVSLPTNVIIPICSTLCHTVNVDHLSDKSIRIMQSLLSHSAIGSQAFQVLLDILSHSNHVALFRGAVFFAGTAKWGPNRIENIQQSFLITLMAMQSSLSHRNSDVAHEILLNLRRLLKKYGETLYTEWDVMLRILLQMEPILMATIQREEDRIVPMQSLSAQLTSPLSTPTSPSTVSIRPTTLSNNDDKLESSQLSTIQVIREVLESVGQRYDDGHFFGSQSLYFDVMEAYRGVCTEQVCILAVKHMQSQIHPAYIDWLPMLKRMHANYFDRESRQAVRIQVLEVLESFLWKFGHLIGESAFGEALRCLGVSLNSVYNNEFMESKIIDIIVKAMRELKLSADDFTELSHLLVKVAASSSVQVSQLRAAQGLVGIFMDKLDKLPCSEAATAFDCLLLLLGQETAAVRRTVIQLIRNMYSNRQFQICIDDRTSPYLKCHTQHSFRTISFTLSMSNLVEALLERVKAEQDAQVFLLLIETLEAFFSNAFILKNTSIARICTSICTTFQERIEFVISSEALNDDTEQSDRRSNDDQKTRQNSHFERSISFINFLSLMAGYSRFLGTQQTNLLISSAILALHRALALSISLLPKSASISTDTAQRNVVKSPSSSCASTSSLTKSDGLIIACLRCMDMLVAECCDILTESQHAQLVMLALDNIHQHATSLSETTIIATLEFLNFLGINCPSTKRGSMVQQCFKFGLSCTDTRQFTHYVALMSHRVLTTWFVRCSFVARQQLIKMSLPVLYERVRENQCTLAESSIDFFVKFAYLSCEQGFTMTDQLRKIFDNHRYKAWSVGNSILTAQPGMFNYVILRYRRPTGTIAWTMKLLNPIRWDAVENMSSIDHIDQESDAHVKNSEITSVVDTAVFPGDSSWDHISSLSRSNDSVSHFIAMQSNTERRTTDSDHPLMPTSLDSVLSLSFEQHDKYLSIARNPLPNPPPIVPQEQNYKPFRETGNLQLEFGEMSSSYMQHEDGESDPSNLSKAAEGEALSEEQSIQSPEADQNTAKQIDEATDPPISFGIGEVIPGTTIPKADAQQQQQQLAESPRMTQYHMELDEDFEVIDPEPYPQSFSSAIGGRSDSTGAHDDEVSERVAPPVPKLDLQPAELEAARRNVDAFATTSRAQLRHPSTSGSRGSVRSSTSIMQMGRTRAASSASLHRSRQDDTITHTTSSTSVTASKDEPERLSDSKFLTGQESLSVSVGAIGKRSSAWGLPRKKGSAKQSSLKHHKKQQPSIAANSQSEQQQQQHVHHEQQSVIHPNFPYLFLRNWAFLSQEEPRGLRVDPSLTRSLHLLDLIPSFETTKFAVLFVAEGQDREEDILSNTHGTPSYFDFIRGLGEFVTLSELDNEYSGGLDRSESSVDGKYALIYKDEIMYVVFHVATMMPNSLVDGKLDHKKRHIGNDYISIVYCESTHPPFDSRTITGQFNFVHIVVYPLVDGLNRVEMGVRDGIELPGFGPVPRVQIISDQALSATVRLMALHADVAIRAWRKERGESVSNWDERLRQIGIIKARHTVRLDNGNNNNDDEVEVEGEGDAELDNFAIAMQDFFD